MRLEKPLERKSDFMRLVSQDGMCDIPYNLYSVYVLKAYDCYKVLASNTESYALATYSTEQKALRAMEMLRKQYSKFEVSKVIACGSAEIMSNQLTQPKVEKTITQFWDITIFQFPKDEEIEV